MGNEPELLDQIIEQNQRLISHLQPCDHCGRTDDNETLFKAQDRILKALALKRKIDPKKPGSAFGGHDDD
jgi:hypothetical protein